VFGDVRIGTSPALLARLAGQSEVPFRVYAGYSGWSPGQLENEIARGDWLVRPGDANFVFFDGDRRLWPALAPKDPRDRAVLEVPPDDQRPVVPSASRITSSGILPG
jgi:putative transcriptional regulator